MTKAEAFKEACAIIDRSGDPERAMQVFFDIGKRLIAEESAVSIGISYGFPPEKIKELEAMEA